MRETKTLHLLLDSISDIFDQCWADQAKVSEVNFLRKPIKVSTFTSWTFKGWGYLFEFGFALKANWAESSQRDFHIFCQRTPKWFKICEHWIYSQKKPQVCVSYQKYKNARFKISPSDFCGCLKNGEWYFWSNPIQNQFLPALKFKSSTCKWMNFSVFPRNKNEWKFETLGPGGKSDDFLLSPPDHWSLTRPLNTSIICCHS